VIRAAYRSSLLKCSPPQGQPHWSLPGAVGSHSYRDILKKSRIPDEMPTLLPGGWKGGNAKRHYENSAARSRHPVRGAHEGDGREMFQAICKLGQIRTFCSESMS
jgi:hypothetical protein